MFVVLHRRCKSIVRKSIDRRARIREAVQKSIRIQTRTYYRKQKSIVSDFSSRDLN
jgi:hypothetical protein